MRKTVPFIATALVSVMITAGIMQASAGAQVEPTFRAVGPASDVFGVGLRITPCNSSPNNANEWHRFSRCSRSNFSAIQKWSTRLDKCMLIYQAEERGNDLYDDGGTRHDDAGAGSRPARRASAGDLSHAVEGRR